MNMKRRSDLILGGLLILIGVITLGQINNWFSIDFDQISKLWPILIILAGVVVLIDQNKNVFNATSVLLIMLAIPFGIYNCTNTTVDNIKDSFGIEDGYQGTYDEEIQGKLDNQTYRVEKNEGINKVHLNIKGGAASFVLVEPVEKEMFLADTKRIGDGRFSLKEQVDGSEHTIDFEMKGQTVIKKSPTSKSPIINFSLNKEPVWDISFDVGASDVRYDLSNYKLEKLKIETGASNLNIKVGNKHPETKIILKSGVANIKVDVPETSGCEIRLDGALSSKSFSGFDKIETGLYRTPNYSDSVHKILIDADTGLSNIVVKRY